MDSRIQQFLCNNEQQIKLLLYCIENQIDLEYLNLHSNTNDDIKFLDMAGVLNYNYATESYEIGKKVSESVKDEIESKVDEYRAVFSKNGDGLQGLIPGALGDRMNIINKLKKWMKSTKNQYTMDDVINTASFYVHDLQKKGSIKYLSAADYFIYKDNRSKLSSLIEEAKNFNRESSNDLPMSNELI